MKVRFVRTEIFETEGRNRGPRFEAGEVYDLSEEMAERWKRRGAAVDAPEPEPVQAAEPASPAPVLVPVVPVAPHHASIPPHRQSHART